MFSTSPTARGRAVIAAGQRLRALPDHGRLPGRPDVRYGFSDRAAGTMSSEVGDGDGRANRADYLLARGMPADHRMMRQVHGATAVAVDRATEAADAPEADGILTSDTDLSLVVLVADCVPVLLAAGQAIAAVHAGRLGVGCDVVAATVAALPESDLTFSVAVIGPAIGPCCYEVEADLAQTFQSVLPGIEATTTWGTPSLDLPGAVHAQLRAAGVARIYRVGGCTRCDADRWFSHRAATQGPHEPGRLGGFITRTSR